jgi:hypothetical protein
MTPAPQLDELIATVHDDAPDQSPLGRLATASAMSSQLTDTADAVLGHFVGLARASGHSWSEIGDALGVSKQAAQQRHVARTSVPGQLSGFTFERFTDRARQTIAQAQTVAGALGHTYIGTEHLLLAQFAAPGGIAAQILSEAGMSEGGVTEAIVADFGRGEKAVDGSLPFTPRAGQALTHALAVALELGHNYIGTEHLLLGLRRVDGGAAAGYLDVAGLSEDILRAKVMERLAGFLAGRSVGPGQAMSENAPEKETAGRKAPAKKAAGSEGAAKKAAGRKSPTKQAAGSKGAGKQAVSKKAAAKKAPPGS